MREVNYDSAMARATWVSIGAFECQNRPFRLRGLLIEGFRVFRTGEISDDTGIRALRSLENLIRDSRAVVARRERVDLTILIDKIHHYFEPSERSAYVLNKPSVVLVVRKS
jgi:hypothetical protein